MIVERNELVRDNIPSLIKAANHECEYSALSNPAYRKSLIRKLEEEVQEYRKTIYVPDSLEKLGDIVDVCYAIAEDLGCPTEQLDFLRSEKLKEKGGFTKGYFLRSIMEVS